MGPGRPLPFLTPTQPTGGVPATGQPDDIAALLEMLQGLEQPLPEVRPPGALQRLSVGVGDALLAAAQVLSRGAAPAPQGGARLAAQTQAQEERRSEVEAQNRARKAQVGTALFQDALVRRRQHEADLRDAKAAAQKAQADKDEDDRKRDEADKEERRKLALEFIRTGRMQPEHFRDADSPPTWPTLAQMATNPAIISQAEVAGALATPAPEGMQKQVTVRPGEEPSLTISPRPETAAEKKAAQGKELTQSEFIQLRQTAKETGDSSLAELADTPERREMILATAKEAATKLATLPQPARVQLTPNLTGEYLAERMMNMLQRPDGTDNDVFGPGSVRLGLTQGAERERFRKAADNLASTFLLSRSGSAVSEKEFERLRSLLPKLNRFHLNNKQAVSELLGYFRANVAAQTPERQAEAVEVLRQRIRREEATKLPTGQPGDVDTGLTLEMEIP